MKILVCVCVCTHMCIWLSQDNFQKDYLFLTELPWLLLRFMKSTMLYIVSLILFSSLSRFLAYLSILLLTSIIYPFSLLKVFYDSYLFLYNWKVFGLFSLAHPFLGFIAKSDGSVWKLAEPTHWKVQDGIQPGPPRAEPVWLFYFPCKLFTLPEA